MYYIYELVSDENIHSELWDIPTSAYIAKQVSPSPHPTPGEGKWSYNKRKNKNKKCMYIWYIQAIDQKSLWFIG